MNNDALFEDYLTNNLSADGVAELKRVLSRDAKARARFVEVLQEFELMSASARQVTSSTSSSAINLSPIEDDEREIHAERELHTDSPSRRRPHVRVSISRPMPRRKFSYLVSGSALAAGIALVLFLTQPMNQPEMPLATVTTAHGQVHILRGKQDLLGAVGMQLFADDRIQVSEGSVLGFHYPDQTSLTIDERSDLTLREHGSKASRSGKRLQLIAGRLSAAVSKQPTGQPMQLTTSNAVVDVLGTQFSLEYKVQISSTRLEVTHGLVAITDRIANKQIKVAQGQFATVVANKELVAQPVVTRVAAKPTGTRQGLRATYFVGTQFGEKLYERIEPNISADLGLESRRVDQREGDFSVRWEGYLLPLYTEKYLLTVRTDGGVRVYVDNRLVIDGWTSNQISEHQASVQLDATKQHPFRVEYRQPKSGMTIRVQWASPSQPPEVIPVERLVTDR